MRAWIAVAVAGIFLLGVDTPLAQDLEPAHFHHFHINSTDRTKTIQFYRKVFGAMPVTFRGVSEGLFTERSFILITEVDARPASMEDTAIRHVGWGGVDGPSEYEWWVSQGLEFQTPLTPLRDNYYMYVYGPDREVLEIYTGEKNHRFNHVHVSADDVAAASVWYEKHLGQRFPLGADRPRPAEPSQQWRNSFRIDNVNYIVVHTDFYYTEAEARPPGRTLQPTQGSAIDHLAFSYRDIEPVYERMRADGVEIVEPIAMREEYDLKSFFVMGPDGVLIEIVEAKPIPEGLWN